MSVWLLFRRVDYEGDDGESARVFKLEQKARQEKERLNKALIEGRGYLDEEWLLREVNLE